jgi:hypothetical protein
MTTDTAISTQIDTKGLIGLADRILRELIRTPKFKEAVIILLNSIDPPAARSLVRTFFWQDPGLLLSILGSLPAFINTGSEALAEAASQMNTMPPLLLKDLLNQVFAGVDGAAAGEAAGGLVKTALALDLSDKESDLSKRLSDLAKEFADGYAAAAGEAALSSRLDSWMASAAIKARDKESVAYAFIDSASKAMRRNPEFVEHVIKPLLAPLLQEPAGKRADAAKKPAKPKQGEEQRGG